jgi:tetratricopeptide (TPR) repeat protein
MKKTFLMLLIFLLIWIMLASCSKPLEKMSAAELLDLGEKYLLEMDYEQAVVQFSKVIEIEPRNPDGYIGLAKAYAGLGKTEKAISVLEDGLKAIPENPELLMMFQEIQSKQESPPEPIDASMENADLTTEAMPDDMIPPPDPISQEEADNMALMAFESAYFTVDSSGVYSIDIDLPSLPKGYYWDVASSIAFPDYEIGIVQNGREYPCEGGGHISVPLTYKEENDFRDTLAGLSLFITAGEPVNDRRGLYEYSSVKVFTRGGTRYSGEDGLFASNNMLDEWKTIEFDNEKLFSAIDISP